MARYTAFLTCTLLLSCFNAYSQNITLEVGQVEKEPTTLILPFVLYSKSLEAAVGLSALGSGHLQPQASIFGAAFTTSNESNAFFIALDDAQIPFAKRLFATFYASTGYYTNQLVYAGINNPGFTDERAGSNESSVDNNIQGEGDDDWFELNFRYLLPTGHARNKPINKYFLKDGFLVDGGTGGDIWNPSKSGRINLELMLFQRYRSFINQYGELSGKTTGIRYAVEYDNRDFIVNPSKGSLQKLSLSKDYGWQDSSDKWTAIQLDLRKYLTLGSSDNFRQRILALNYWTSYNPSWEVIQTSSGIRISGRSPSYMGSALGGLTRLRAYPIYRYSDKAAVYYAAELRLTPKWNPFSRAKFLKPLEVDWIQIVPFVEIGRVAPEWSLSTLHTDMKKVAGLGFRLMAQKVVYRLDVAVAEDSWSMWAMVGHPF